MTDTDFDTWLICRHKFPDGGRSAVITVNDTFEQRLKFADFPFHVSIAIDAVAEACDFAGRIGPHESRHLLELSRKIRASLEGEDQHLVAIMHGAGARTLVIHARDGGRIARRLNELQTDMVWDRKWNFEVRSDPEGNLVRGWRDIAAASEEHHLSVNVPHARDGETADHHHYLF